MCALLAETLVRTLDEISDFHSSGLFHLLYFILDTIIAFALARAVHEKLSRL